MKIAVILLTILALIGLTAGIVLIAFGEIAFAGIVWAVTVILSCIAYKMVVYGKKKK